MSATFSHRPASLLPLLVAVGLVVTVATGCPRDKAEDPWQYHPGQEAYNEVMAQYDRDPVRHTAGGVQVVGYEEEQLRLPTAEERARDDAISRLFSLHLVEAVEERAAGARDHFYENPGDALIKLAEHLTKDPNGPYYRWLELSEELAKYELYQRYTLPADREEALVDELVKMFHDQGPREPIDIPFSVVLADMPAELDYEEKLERVVRAVQQELQGLGTRADVVVVDEEEGFDRSEVETRKQELLHSLPHGTTVEASVVFQHTSRNRIDWIAITDIRGREMEPVDINNHPTPRGGRYDYNIKIPSLLIRKGQDELTVRVRESTGREFVVDYELTPSNFEYSDENIGLLEIQEFDGHIQHLMDRLHEVRLMDEDGRRSVTLRLPPRLRFDSRPGQGHHGLQFTRTFEVGLYRPGATTVYALEQRVNRSDFQSLDNVERLNWVVVWEHYDPEGMWGDLDGISIPEHEGEGDLYVRIDYNNDRDVDVLRFNVGGRDDGAAIGEGDAELVFSTSERN